MAHIKPAILTIYELDALAGRLDARAVSKLLAHQPELQGDLKLAARVIAHLIRTGAIHKTLDLTDAPAGNAA